MPGGIGHGTAEQHSVGRGDASPLPKLPLERPAVSCQSRGMSVLRASSAAGSGSGKVGAMVQRSPLDELQLAVLRWVAEGHPDGPLASPGNRNRAQALANRGLVTIRRGKPGRRAALTEAGRHYLDHGDYPVRPTRAPRRESAPVRPQSTDPAAAAILTTRGPRRMEHPEPERDWHYLIPPKARGELRLRKHTIYRRDTQMRYKVRVTRVQVAEQYIRATDPDTAAEKAREEFEKPYAYYGSWNTVASG